MEAAGANFKENLLAFLKPAFKDWRTAFRTLWKSTTFLICALPIGLGFAIAAWRYHRKKK